MKRSVAMSPCIIAAALVIQTEAVRADAIDGEWCSGDGRHLSIQGPTIITPGGTRMQGTYSRHSFVYTTPPNEASAGQEVFMQLLSETIVNVREGAASAQIWRRCAERTS